MSTTKGNAPEAWTGSEARALGLWRAREAPAGFADRVVAQARAEGVGGAARGFAVAAVALVLVGGFITVGALLGRTPAVPMVKSPGLGATDAGGPEARPTFDGTMGEAS